jgi:hypothetical protein
MSLQQALSNAWRTAAPNGLAADYVLLHEAGIGFIGRHRDGHPAILIPLAEHAGNMIGRSGSGCELSGHPALTIEWLGRRWEAPAAVLVCTARAVEGAFAIFGADVLERVAARPTWRVVLEVVDEWQLLLAPRGRASVEAELGLWAELWFISLSTSVDDAVAAWLGPDREPVDFFRDGRAVDLKASTKRRQHYVSLRQVVRPVGDHEAWLLSLWVQKDPVAGCTVPALVDRILAASTDAATTLRRVARAGYTELDRALFDSSYLVLAEPEWYADADVPRVREADAGVSQIRYVVSLDECLRADVPTARTLWRHFLGSNAGTWNAHEAG